ncbi:MAG TPA: hypothetical protein VHN14_35615 [Kofleriaceae bacterium]|jgi:hypothetical protein|nr:hypothetical protein [Kofleriaceae bacterium]
MTSQTKRLLVNGFLAVFLMVMAIDVFVSQSESGEGPRDAINTLLVWTGLWQGPWRLYAPDVDNINLRVRAEVMFADHATATWNSPDWSQRSALHKFVGARHINYFNAVLLADKQVEWNALCAYLARTLPHPQGKAVAVEQVRLLLQGAIIPKSSEKRVPAGPYLDFDPWSEIWVWKPPA